MQSAINELGVRFSLPKIMCDLRTLVYADEAFSQDKFLVHNQFSLRESVDWFGGVGSLFDYSQGKMTKSTIDFCTPCTKLKDSYLSEVISKVEEVGRQDGVNIGRIRVMRIHPKTCYSLHTDPEEFRYHIPLETNSKCFFVVGNDVVRMPTTGMLYRFKTNCEHTAVNASFSARIHIVFDTYV